MGELLLCRFKTAETPYYLENYSVNIYSLEELCYCMEQNPYLIEESLFQESFFGWVEKELSAKPLADELRLCGQKAGHPVQAVSLLLEKTAYCNEEAAERILESLSKMQAKSPFESRKIRADRYMEQKKYHRAASEYQKLLTMEEECRENRVFTGNIRHNLGTAYAGLFLFREAADCFLKAYEENGNQVTLHCALACFWYQKDRTDFDAAAKRYSIAEAEKKELTDRLIEAGGKAAAESFAEQVEEWLRQSGGDLLEDGELKKQLYGWKAEYINYCEI